MESVKYNNVGCSNVGGCGTRAREGRAQGVGAQETTAYLKQMEERMVQTVGEPGVLGQWVESLFPKEQVTYVWALYRVGALADGRTVFHYTNRMGFTIDGKVMAYGPDGHRVKERISEQRSVNSEQIIANEPKTKVSSDHCSLITDHSSPRKAGGGFVTWLHALERLERPLPLPLFGEHLLPTLPFAPVCLVESEKTALIAKLWRPDCTWLATGGKGNFTAERLQPLRGRQVFVWPDEDALTEWMGKAAELGPHLDIRFEFPQGYLR